MFYLMKKLSDTKWTEVKSINYEIDKISLSCFDDRRYVLDDPVVSCKEIKKDCDNWKILW